MNNCKPKRFDIERYFAGELDPTSSASLEGHIETCTVCFSYLQNLRREKNEFLADHPFSSFYSEKIKNVSVPWYNVFNKALTRPVLVPVFGLLLVLAAIPLVTRFTDYYNPDTVMFKGRHQLSFIYERHGKVKEGKSSDLYREGDRIQVLYNSKKDQFLALISIDSKGTVSFYHPDQQSYSCSVPSGTGTGLPFPGSILLDNSAGGELIVALFSQEPLQTEIVKQLISQIHKKHQALSDLQNALEDYFFGKGSEIATLLLKKG